MIGCRFHLVTLVEFGLSYQHQDTINSVINAEKGQQERLKRQFNREAAEWTVVRKKTKMAYFTQNNPERVAILENLRFDLINSLMENDQLRLASAQKLAELSKLKELNERFSSRLSLNHQETGNGN